MARYNSSKKLDDYQSRDSEFGFKGFNNRLRPDQLPQGTLVESLNGRCDLNMEWQPRKGLDLKVAPFSTAVLALDFFLYDSLPSVSSYTQALEVLTINFSAVHGITDPAIVDPPYRIINLSGLSVSGGADPNGNRIATYVDTDTVTVNVSGLTVLPTGTLTVTGAKLDDTVVNAVYGSTAFYDDSSSLAPYIILAGNSKAVAVNLNTLAQTDLSYPTGEVISSSVGMVEFFGKVIILREGDTAMEWDGDISSPSFSLVANGAFTQPANLAATGFTITDGLATVTVANTLSVGDKVTLSDAGSSTLLDLDEWEVASATASVFTFYVDAADLTNQTDVVFIETVSKGQGFRHMPCPGFAVHHQGRLAMPFSYDQTGSSGSPTITDREVRDEFILSKVQDSNVYDYIFGQFKAQGDVSDYLVGMHSFNEDKLVIFNRESIHILGGSADLKTSTLQLLTNEVGCVARKSILQVGNKMMFLSDNGVYALDFLDLYNLRGNDIPLSESIDSTIKRINPDYAENAEAAYFDNRYYLSVALDDSTRNNALIVYNFLNREWESIDTVDNASFDFPQLLVAGSGSSRGLYCCNTNGGIHKLESREDDKDVVIGAIGGSQESLTILGTATTRMFTLGGISRKKWNAYELHVQSSDSNSSDGTLTAIVENVDATIALGTLSSVNGGMPIAQSEDVSLRARLGNHRAYGLQLKLETTQGRPRLRTLEVSGMDTFKSTTKAE